MNAIFCAKTNIGLRGNNEDNYIVSVNLSNDDWLEPESKSSQLELADKGCLLMVADGMGGQNAGEVASSIAVEAVKEMFSSKKISRINIGQASAVKAYIKEVIREADRRVKSHAQKHPDSEGMGSTIVLAWILDGVVFIGWLGDSRAYSFVPNKGIGRLSKDHSYVQRLIDKGEIDEIQAMHHQNSNIITRSLGDTSSEAKPDVVAKPLEDGEIIMLCSDGLCGVCTDERIGNIIDRRQTDLSLCVDNLIESALSEGGSDNITIAMAQVATPKVSSIKLSYSSQWKKLLSVIVLFCAMLLSWIFSLFLYWENRQMKEIDLHEFLPRDSTLSIIQVLESKITSLESENKKIKEALGRSETMSRTTETTPLPNNEDLDVKQPEKPEFSLSEASDDGGSIINSVPDSLNKDN